MRRSAQLTVEVGLATAIPSLLLRGAQGVPHVDSTVDVAFVGLYRAITNTGGSRIASMNQREWPIATGRACVTTTASSTTLRRGGR